MMIDLASPMEMVDLSHPMVTGMPNFDSAPEYRLVPNLRLGDFELADGYWGCNEFVMMSGHSGTHLDALGHVAHNQRVHGNVPAGDAQSGIAGLVTHSIDDVGPILRRGVVLDVASHLGVSVMEPGQPVDAALVAAISESVSIEIEAGDCVLVRTGWQAHWSEPATYLGIESGLPGITVDALEWIASRGGYLVGSDTGVVEMTEPGMGALPVHMAALVRRGVFLLENMALDGLIGRPPSFAFFAAPLRLRGSSGSPVRPIAIFQ